MHMKHSSMAKEIARKRLYSDGLVASWYRQIVDEQAPSREQAEARKTRALKRVITALGRDEVIRRLRQAQVGASDDLTRAWLVLEAMGLDVRHEKKRTM